MWLAKLSFSSFQSELRIKSINSSSLLQDKEGRSNVGRHISKRYRCKNSQRWVTQVKVASFEIMEYEEDNKIFSTPISNWWYSIAVIKSIFEGLHLVNEETKWLIACALQVISRAQVGTANCSWSTTHY